MEESSLNELADRTLQQPSGSTPTLLSISAIRAGLNGLTATNKSSSPATAAAPVHASYVASNRSTPCAAADAASCTSLATTEGPPPAAAAGSDRQATTAKRKSSLTPQRSVKPKLDASAA